MSDQWSSQEPSTWEGSSETSSTTDTAKAEASNVAQTSKQGAAQVAGTAKEQGQQVLSEATSQAKNLVDETKSQVASQAGQQQQRAAGNLRSLGDELRSMADSSDSSGIAAQLVQQASDQVQQLAGWLDSRDPSGVLDDVRSFARRKPGAFLIGAAAAGLLAGRATRAGVDIKRDSSASSDGYAGPGGYPDATSTMPPVTPAQPQYPYDASDVGGTYASGGTYAAGTYTGDTYTGDTYTGETYTGDTYTGGTAGGTHAGGTETADTTWTDPGEPRR